MIGWEDRRKAALHALLITLLVVAVAGFFAGYYAGTHRCPAEDSCSYVNKQWTPTEH